MKKILMILVCLVLSVNVFSQEPLIISYAKFSEIEKSKSNRTLEDQIEFYGGFIQALKSTKFIDYMNKSGLAWIIDDKIYVENKVAQTINIIDTKTLTVVDYIDMAFMPGQIAYNQTLNELWICQAGENKVAYFERKNNLWSLKGTIITGNDAHAITFSKDMKKNKIQ
jgi:YVTN family beta-propeller protein